MLCFGKACVSKESVYLPRQQFQSFLNRRLTKWLHFAKKAVSYIIDAEQLSA